MWLTVNVQYLNEIDHFHCIILRQRRNATFINSSVSWNFLIFSCFLESAFISYSTTVGQFNTNYVFYMTYSVTDKGRASLNLLDGAENWNIHVDARYSTDDVNCKKSQIVLNNFYGNNWQTEIRPVDFPFLTGKETTMMIIPQATKYRVFFEVEGKTYTYYFPYRNGHKPEQVTKLEAISKDAKCTTTNPKIISLVLDIVYLLCLLGPRFTLKAQHHLMGKW